MRPESEPAPWPPLPPELGALPSQIDAMPDEPIVASDVRSSESAGSQKCESPWTPLCLTPGGGRYRYLNPKRESPACDYRYGGIAIKNIMPPMFNCHPATPTDLHAGRIRPCAHAAAAHAGGIEGSPGSSRPVQRAMSLCFLNR